MLSLPFFVALAHAQPEPAAAQPEPAQPEQASAQSEPAAAQPEPASAQPEPAQPEPEPALGVPKEPAVISFAGRRVEEGIDVVTVTLTTADGEETVITLHDDGVVPDRVAGDGLFMGTAWYSGDAATAVVQVGDTVYPPLDIPFQKGITAPVAHFTLNGGVLAVEVDAPGTGGGARPGKQDGARTGGWSKADAKTSGKARRRSRLERIRRNQAKTTRGSNDTPIYVLAGVSVLATLAMGVLLFRGGLGRGRDPLGGLVPEPEPGLADGALPSLSDGLMVWACDPTDRPRLRAAALRTLAARRRVLVAVPEDAELPAVGGHPAYRAEEVSLDAIEHDLEALLDAMAVPVALLIEGLDADDLAELVADAPPGTGGVVLADGPVAGLPVRRFTRTADGWRVEGGEAPVEVVDGPGGLGLAPGAVA